jgi:hypothetical protein
LERHVTDPKDDPKARSARVEVERGLAKCDARNQCVPRGGGRCWRQVSNAHEAGATKRKTKRKTAIFVDAAAHDVTGGGADLTTSDAAAPI